METNENNNPSDPTPPSVPPAPPVPPTPPPPVSSVPPGAPPPVAPDAPHPSGISKDERLWGALCHILPLIIWLIKREGMPFVDDQGKEALNFQITVFIAVFGLSILSLIPVVGCLLSIVSLLICLASFVLAVMGAIKANDGIKYRYPWSLKLIK